jgi:hypothetical protein
VTLPLVFAMLVVGLTALFLGVSVVAHGYLYMEPAKKLPLRALGGGLLLGGFITLWAGLDKKSPGKYDTFFNFSPYTTAEFGEFEAVRWPVGADGQLKGTEVAVKFKRTVGGKGAAFVEEGTNDAFKLSTGAYMTGAIRVKGPGDAEPVRYNALVNENPRTKSKEYAKERRFVEEKGDRYVEAVQLGTLFVPSGATVAVSLLLNFTLLVLWLVVQVQPPGGAAAGGRQEPEAGRVAGRGRPPGRVRPPRRIPELGISRETGGLTPGVRATKLMSARGGVAQLVERLNGIQEVRSSTLLTSTSHKPR